MDALSRLQAEGLSRHDAIHAIGSVLAAQVYDGLKAEERGEVNAAYAEELNTLTAESWRRSIG